MRRTKRRAAALATGLAAALASGPAAACGLALALAIDASSSVSRAEFALQTRGHAAAFRDPEVIAAIRGVGGIQAMALQWSGDVHQQIIAPWRRLETEAEILAFADVLAAAPRRFEILGTALGSALAALGTAFEGPPASCNRYVVDVSGDGISNGGFPVAPARALLLDQGVTINGLVIVNDEPVEADPVPFYRNEVIGGPGAFMMIANGFEDYARAFRQKLLREIGLPFAGAPADAPTVEIAAE